MIDHTHSYQPWASGSTKADRYGCALDSLLITSKRLTTIYALSVFHAQTVDFTQIKPGITNIGEQRACQTPNATRTLIKVGTDKNSCQR